MSKIVLEEEKEALCCFLIRLSSPSRPIPDILEDIPGKKLSTILLLNPIISKFLPPRYELIIDMPILLIIFLSPFSIAFLKFSIRVSKVIFP